MGSNVTVITDKDQARKRRAQLVKVLEDEYRTGKRLGVRLSDVEREQSRNFADHFSALWGLPALNLPKKSRSASSRMTPTCMIPDCGCSGPAHA